MPGGDSEFGPDGISFADAYAAIRGWCLTHADHYKDAPGMSARSMALIAALPEVEDASEVEMKAVFGEIIAGNLLWAYKKSDGLHRMAGYAHGALEGAGMTYEISDPVEREQLVASPIGPYLFCARFW